MINRNKEKMPEVAKLKPFVNTDRSNMGVKQGRPLMRKATRLVSCACTDVRETRQAVVRPECAVLFLRVAARLSFHPRQRGPFDVGFALAGYAFELKWDSAVVRERFRRYRSRGKGGNYELLFFFIQKNRDDA